MKIRDIEIGLGETREVKVHIANLPSQTPLKLSVTVARAKEPGPVVLFLGGMHGDEINGIEIVRRLIEQDLHQPTRGTVICIPIVNIFGFIHFSRYVPDGKDVNRSFPGNKNGSLASRVAHYLMTDIIPQIDLGLDFHTGGAERTNYPQIRCLTSKPELMELAQACAPPYILHASHRANSLRQAAARLGKSILVYEGGESTRFDELAIQEGINAATRLLQHLDMTDAVPSEPRQSTVIITNSSWVRAKASGLFQPNVPSGAAIVKSQVLGYLTDPFGEYKHPLKAQSKGYVIGINNNPLVHAGDALIHIGMTEPLKAKKTRVAGDSAKH